MGLDQYGLKRKDGKAEEIAYFRKNNALHGWMEALWVSKGRPFPGTEECGTTETLFNCIPLELSEDDLIKLGQDAKEYNLPETQGFFFGSDSSQNQHHMDNVLEFVDVGLKAIQEGYEIAYNSWW
jgi:hypothetical protein|tara:strand:+ start:364 stop:738 length:375 start_codon:yes stop_codon:yes gene_type:complete